MHKAGSASQTKKSNSVNTTQEFTHLLVGPLWDAHCLTTPSRNAQKMAERRCGRGTFRARGGSQPIGIAVGTLVLANDLYLGMLGFTRAAERG